MSRRRRLVAAGLMAAALAAAGAPAPAAAQTAGSQGPGEQTLTVAPQTGLPPPGRRQTAQKMTEAALRVPKIARLREERKSTFTRSYLKEGDQWQVSLFERRADGEEEIGQVILDDRSGRVLEVWTGVQVVWTMARGYPGAFGRRANALYIWIPLLVLFVLPFLRPPLRWVHADLAAVAALSVSFAFFDAAKIGASVPLAYPPLVYLLIRMLLLARDRARRGNANREALRLLVGPDFLGMAIVFLLGFRLGLNLTSSNVIDVGYAGVIGADRVAHGEALYGNFPSDNAHGDTYGPLVYLAYLPFELIWPWKGTWDELVAAHATALAFDAAMLAMLYVAGRRYGGATLAVLLPFLWLACPFTLLATNSATNDTLIGVTVLGALLLATRPMARGAAVGAAAMAKFAPLALAPLFATHPPPARGRTVVRTGLGLALAVGALLALTAALDGGLTLFWERTIAFQADRDSPFSLWGWYDLPALQLVVQVAAAALAIAVAFVPRRRDDVGLAALTAAVLLALQLGVSHWFYLYVVWFLPLVLVASVGEHGEPVTSRVRPGSTDSRGESPPHARPSADRPSTQVAHHVDARPIDDPAHPPLRRRLIHDDRRIQARAPEAAPARSTPPAAAPAHSG